MNAQPLQRSEDWFAARVGKITASRVGAILGVSKYRTAEDVMRSMVREAFGAAPEFIGNEATRYGEAHEQDALDSYTFATDSVVTPSAAVVHPDHPWLAASPDGLVGDDGLVECKAPYRARYTAANEEYRAQMQLQMACTGRSWCDFVIWRCGEELIIERHTRDDAWLVANLPALREFHERYEAIVASAELAAPYLADAERKDDEWLEWVTFLRFAEQRLQFAEDDRKLGIAKLAELAPHGAKGCGLTLSMVERQGSIAYAKALHDLLPDADLEPYRGASSTYYKTTWEKDNG